MRSNTARGSGAADNLRRRSVRAPCLHGRPAGAIPQNRFFYIAPLSPLLSCQSQNISKRVKMPDIDFLCGYCRVTVCSVLFVRRFLYT